jgi:hypothetical protein
VARNSDGNSTAYDPRQIWATNLAPLVVAAREGAAQAARTASRERARARQQPAWWQRRWVIVSAAGLAVVGAAGGVYAAVANRRGVHRGYAVPTDTGMSGTPGAGQERANGLRSTMDTGKARMTDAARTMVHKLRGDEHTALGPESSRMPGSTSTMADGSRNDLRPTESGYQQSQP